MPSSRLALIDSAGAASLASSANGRHHRGLEVKQTRVSNSMRCLLVWSTLAAAAAVAQVSAPVQPPAAPQVRNSPPRPASDGGSSRAARQFETGLQLAADHKTDAAIAVFAGLTRDYPGLREPYQQLAALYAKRGDMQRAVTALQTAVKLGVQDSQLQEQLGDLYVQLAAGAYRQALQADQPSKSARNKYSIIQSVNPPPVRPGARPP